MNSSEFFSEPVRKWRLATANGTVAAAAEAGTPGAADSRANPGAVRLPKMGGDSARARMAARGMQARAPTAMNDARSEPFTPTAAPETPKMAARDDEWKLGAAADARTPRSPARPSHARRRARAQPRWRRHNGLDRGGGAAITCAGGRVGGRAGSGHARAPDDAAQMASRDGRSRHVAAPNANSGGLAGMGRPVWPEASEQADLRSRHALRRPCDTFGAGGPQTRSSVRYARASVSGLRSGFRPDGPPQALRAAARGIRISANLSLNYTDAHLHWTEVRGWIRELREGSGGRGWNRTIDPSRVKRMLYR